MNRRKIRSGLAIRACVAACVVLTSLAGCGSDDSSPALSIKTVSNRADLVSGGDALVEIVLPTSASSAGLKVELDGTDVTSAFATNGDGRLMGLVTGLKAGENNLSAFTASAAAAKLTITNHDRGGPVYSGAQVMPFVCATPVPVGASGNMPATNHSGLSTNAIDAKCNIATEYKLYYKTTTAVCTTALPDPVIATPYTSTAPVTTAALPSNPCFKPYTAGSTPADMATTTTDAGLTVPYIVRVERGTINRGIYDIAVLYDPAKPWNGAQPQAQWNGKLLYYFGSSTGQPRRQVRPATAWTDDRALGRGYAVAVNSMTDSQKNSNRVMMSETLMMMKEHISDNYGPIKFTVGSGCSGGSIASNLSASISPGLLDGVTVSCTYPDSETVTIEVSDCVLLVEAYQKAGWLNLQAGLSPAQINAKKAAINGHMDHTACHGWYNLFGSNAKAGNYFQRTVQNHDTGAIAQSTTSVNNCELPASQVYDPVTNPGGARCNAWSWAESIWGKVSGQAAAKETRDNVGVQYGLDALNKDVINAEEFVTLNEIIGGMDADTNFTAARSAANADALTIAYRAGIVLNGKQLAKTAIIDMRGFDDSVIDPPVAGVPLFGIHHQWRSFGIRDRLDRDAGGHDNQVMWRFGRFGFFPSAQMSQDAFVQMDDWLTRVKADTSSKTIQQKIAASKPTTTFDYCLLSGDATQSTKVTDPAQCNADKYLVPYRSPRQVAGGPRTEDVLKCQLKPILTADYGGKLSGDQIARLQAVFPEGVCDWSKPGVGQQDSISPLNFKAGPGGQPFDAVPVSVAR